MKQGRSLPEVLTELQRQNAAKQDYIGAAAAFRLADDGSTFNIGDDHSFGTTSLFHRQIASALSIPAKYYDMMQKQKPELLAENVNTWFSDKNNSYMVRTLDYGNGQVARALLSDRYRRIDNLEIATGRCHHLQLRSRAGCCISSASCLHACLHQRDGGQQHGGTPDACR